LLGETDMSGPKTSRYTLTAEQRRILREARELERKTKAAFERKEQLRKSMNNLLSASDEFVERANVIIAESGKELPGFDEFKEFRKSAANAITNSSKVNIQSGLDALRTQEDVLQREYNQLVKAKTVLEQKLPKMEQQFRAELNETIISGLQLSFANIGSDRELKENPYIEKIQSALDGIVGLHFSKELREKWTMVQKKAKEIDNSEFLKNFYAVTVLPFVKECKQYDELYSLYGKTYDELICEYKMLAEEAGEEVEEIPFSEDAISKLQNEIEQLDAMLSGSAEQAYISQCIDEVMIEMGYNLIGSREVTKKSGKHFRNELYLFDEGTAVNVTTSDDGQITMELAGLDDEDRIPSATESEQLCQDMQEFCTDYREIEKRLAARGVTTRRISILPPEEQYAQIINTADYNMKTDVSHFESTRKKRQSVSNATLHKGV